MSRSRRSFLLGMGLLLSFGSSGNTQPPLRPSRASSPPSALRTDQYGDPLPDGAIARLGTVRLRHAARVREMEFVANGRLLASLGDDCICHLWDSTTGREVGRFARPVTKAQNPEQMMLDLHFRHIVPQFTMPPETPAMCSLPNCLRGMEPLLAVKETWARGDPAEPSTSADRPGGD